MSNTMIQTIQLAGYFWGFCLVSSMLGIYMFMGRGMSQHFTRKWFLATSVVSSFLCVVIMVVALLGSEAVAEAIVRAY